MQNHLSQLPAPLPLYILLELPNLKALYAAILSSPHLYATFRLNARHVFDTIAHRSMPNELINLIYMHLHLQQQPSDEFKMDLFGDFQVQDRFRAVKLALASSRHTTSAANVFRVVAQGVLLYDIGRFILRSKLDYLKTLQLQKLADPRFNYMLYDRDLVMRQNPEGTTLHLAASFGDPSWLEEGRVLWGLWRLSIARLISHKFAACSYGNALDSVVRTQVNFSPLAHRWTDNIIAEITNSMVAGTRLQPPASARASSPKPIDLDHLTVVQPYLIPHPPYLTIIPSSKELVPTAPVFSWCPADVSEPSHHSVVWSPFDAEFQRENPSARYVRAMENAPYGPIQAQCSDVFDRLGFGFWDTRRICADFELRMPRRHLEMDPSLYGQGGPKHVSMSGGLFRLLGIYKQEREREKDGWKRAVYSMRSDLGRRAASTDH
ncbi:hypothetical protein AUEXF2481DRAFT_167476 [Aureobasidium subglaciale EXF-2481]|uniref:Uncharacterized protein n=1 Tax=Aureobasidium subglaciale (strain EXF-2481) TaxID=1043005 RepID=A0A074ZRL7_AURSE|nr:uncharacterized protein AUEXF2481DRAFT_167476 [Aureobasidium subglaciale EXF-2481]KER00922.1 hypothetical protein AUEXF2481DRAFT_167476 [Aureobasidium subglaciale EXF-2481]